MAARLNPRHQQFVRDKIQAQKLILSLQNHVDGKSELSATQIQAAKILLDKSISNAPTEIKQDINGAVTVTSIKRVIIDPVNDTDA